jgi:[ribosomal protein S5]-alanine N-acetyltransferase
VSRERQAARTTKELLIPMSLHLEDRILGMDDPAVVLACFQDVRHFDAATRPAPVARYRTLGISAGHRPTFNINATQAVPSQRRAPVAQRIEQGTSNPKVAGSNPAGRARRARRFEVLTMLRGSEIDLRLVRDGDLEPLYELMSDLETRGPYFPLGVMSQPALRAAFDKNGFWDTDEGMLLIVKDGEIVGEIEYFPITHYLQGYEISYQLFGRQYAGRGYTTDAVNLLVTYLFGRKRVNRMQLNIHPGNAASKRVAQKCGFTFEGIMRGCWFHRGAYQDLEVWSLLRDEAVSGR